MKDKIQFYLFMLHKYVIFAPQNETKQIKTYIQ